MTRLALLVWGTPIVAIIGIVLVVILARVADAIDLCTEARAEEQAWVQRALHVNAEARLKLAQTRAAADEAVLLGPVSAWVAEGEARAIRGWERKRPDPNSEQPADISDIRMTTIRS